MIDQESVKAETTDLARKVAASNPGLRVAVSESGSGIAIYNATRQAWESVIERVITGSYVYAGVNNPSRVWEEIIEPTALRLAPTPLPAGIGGNAR